MNPASGFGDAAWLFTRPGFETEAGGEWRDRAGSVGIHGSCEAFPGAGLVRFESGRPIEDPALLRRKTAVQTLTFVRDALFELRIIDPLPSANRVAALLEGLKDFPAEGQWGEVAVHVPEGSQNKDLSNFARKWTAPVASALRAHGWLTPQRRRNVRRLELILPDFNRLIVGQSYPGHRAVCPGGRPRLRLPREAPSRATLKIEEAFLTLLSEAERAELLAPGMTAVDLGAAPGGWTFHLVRCGLFVTAVDNGPMDEALMRTGMVEHLKADGFTWMPEVPCDWMVCDIVDKPRRTVDLVARWLRDGRCRASVFNLKLPMKKRLEEWYLCRDRLETALAATGRPFDIRAKQLYHDREEITVLVLPDQ